MNRCGACGGKCKGEGTKALTLRKGKLVSVRCCDACAKTSVTLVVQPAPVTLCACGAPGARCDACSDLGERAKAVRERAKAYLKRSPQVAYGLERAADFLEQGVWGVDILASAT